MGFLMGTPSISVPPIPPVPPAANPPTLANANIAGTAAEAARSKGAGAAAAGDITNVGGAQGLGAPPVATKSLLGA